MSENSVTINGKTYPLSSLRCKHLRQITKILSEGRSGQGFSDIEKWMPFIAESIKIQSPNFNPEELDELTLQEFSDTWETIVKISGVKLVRGEVTPVQRTTSTGETSTEESVPESAAIPTVN